MMEATDFRDLHYPTHRRGLDRAGQRRVLLQSEMSSRQVVVTEIRGKNPPEMSFVEDDQVVDALSPDRSDDVLTTVCKLDRSTGLDWTVAG